MRVRAERAVVGDVPRLDLSALVPEVVGRWVANDPATRYYRVEGCVLVASATDAARALPGEALGVARRYGGTVLKFTGRRLAVFFDGPDRNADAEATGAALCSRFGVAVGMADEAFNVFLVGCGHREFFASGATIHRALRVQSRVSDAAVQSYPTAPRRSTPWPHGLARTSFVPEIVRHRSTDSEQTHDVPVAVIHLANLDELVDEAGAKTTTRHLHDLVTRIQHSFASHDVAFLGSDVAAGGPTILCAAGMTRAGSDDDDRLVQALRDITDYPSPIELRTSVARGIVTSGFVRSEETLTFVVNGTTISELDELVGHADPSEILATSEVIARTGAAYQDLIRIGTRLVYRIRKPIRHHRGTINMLVNVGTLAFEHEDFAGAKQYFEQAVSISRQLLFRSDEAFALTYLARVALAMGDPELTMVRCDEALEIRRILGDDLGVAELLTLLGRARHADGDSATARHCWLRAIAILGRLRTSAAAEPSA